MLLVIQLEWCYWLHVHQLEFNSMKTQLMCFHCPSVHPITADIYLNIKLSFVSYVKHLGHILSSNLEYTLDIQRAVKI